MKLFWSSRSPFVRKVMVAAHELGLADRIELERVVVSARTTNAGVMAANPLGRIPTLVLDGGGVVFDSPLILEYFESLQPGPVLLPREPARRQTVQQLQALGDGLMSLNVLRLGEKMRAEHASAAHQEAYAAKTAAVLDSLETKAATLAPISAGGIAIACGLSHLDFRFPEQGWRATHPALATWHEAFARRPSMRATEHSDEC